MNHFSNHLFYQLNTRLEMESFQSFLGQIIPTIVRSGSHAGWVDAIRNGWSGNAFASRTMMEVLLAISLLQQSRVVPERRIKAIQYYDGAISRLRHQIDQIQTSGGEQELLFSAASCAFFEVGILFLFRLTY